MFDGMANPMPWAWVSPCGLAAARVGMPMSSPAVFTGAPPLLSGLIGALVWIAPGSVAPREPVVAGPVTARPVADAMPSLTLPAARAGC